MNCYFCLTLELYYIYVLIFSFSIILLPLINVKAVYCDTGGMSVSPQASLLTMADGTMGPTIE